MIAFSSRWTGGILHASSLDCALAMNTVSQPDPLDSTCVPPADTILCRGAARRHWNKLRIGVIKPCMDAARIDAPVLDCVNGRSSKCRSGREGSSSNCRCSSCAAAYYIITAAECSSTWRALWNPLWAGKDQVPPPIATLHHHPLQRLRRGGRRRILLGRTCSARGSARSTTTTRARCAATSHSVREAVQKLDVIATPTHPRWRSSSAPHAGREVYLADIVRVRQPVRRLRDHLPCGFGEDAIGTRLRSPAVVARHSTTTPAALAAQYRS